MNNKFETFAANNTKKADQSEKKEKKEIRRDPNTGQVITEDEWEQRRNPDANPFEKFIKK
jgi:hypothetical protein